MGGKVPGRDRPAGVWGFDFGEEGALEDSRKAVKRPSL
jgi:hypothetical protein